MLLLHILCLLSIAPQRLTGNTASFVHMVYFLLESLHESREFGLEERMKFCGIHLYIGL